VVPTWTLLAALAAGLILGALGWRVLFRPAVVTAPAQDGPGASAAGSEHEPTPPPPPEPVRIPMEDVVSELEHRYQGRRADKPAEKRPAAGADAPSSLTS
jgi:hypothetical protein